MKLAVNDPITIALNRAKESKNITTEPKRNHITKAMMRKPSTYWEFVLEQVTLADGDETSFVGDVISRSRRIQTDILSGRMTTSIIFHDCVLKWFRNRQASTKTIAALDESFSSCKRCNRALLSEAYVETRY